MRPLKAALALLCLNTISCSDFENKRASSPEVVRVESVLAESFADQVKATVQPTAKPERYMVYLSWPKVFPENRIRIRMDRVLAVVKPEQTTFSHEVDHNQTLTYRFDVLNENDSIKESFSKLVKVPRDFVVKENQNEIFEDSKIFVERIFLPKNTPLTTNGHNVTFITKLLVSDSGEVQTFKPQAKAGINSDGRSGGNLLIEAETATGVLSIKLRGENGGDGAKGDAYSSRAHDGVPPGSGRRECEVDDNRNTSTDSFFPTRCSCSERGGNGGNAENGQKGNRGHAAGLGGDSGTLKIRVNDGSAFQIEILKFPGIAGLPGPGGDGQPGGIAIENKGPCSGKPGTNGTTGPPGDEGPTAKDGDENLACIYIASEGKNECF